MKLFGSFNTLRQGKITIDRCRWPDVGCFRFAIIAGGDDDGGCPAATALDVNLTGNVRAQRQCGLCGSLMKCPGGLDGLYAATSRTAAPGSGPKLAAFTVRNRHLFGGKELELARASDGRR